jgi:hypothetical protein
MLLDALHAYKLQVCVCVCGGWWGGAQLQLQVQDMISSIPY